MNLTVLDEMEVKKKAFIEAYVKSFGNITRSCKAIDITRQTYYNWMEADADFKAEVEACEPLEVFLDFAENSLIKKIHSGDTTAIIFALKTKGKKRGYVERQEIEASGGLVINWNIEKTYEAQPKAD